MPEKLLKEYAQNRINMKDVNDKIKEIVGWRQDLGDHGEYRYVDLADYRRAWLEDNLDMWSGWECAVTNFEDHEATEEEINLAKLLDQKANLRKELGAIRRKIYSKGRSLILSGKKTDSK